MSKENTENKTKSSEDKSVKRKNISIDKVTNIIRRGKNLRKNAEIDRGNTDISS